VLNNKADAVVGGTSGAPVSLPRTGGNILRLVALAAELVAIGLALREMQRRALL
jgi:hypothetical protein